MSDLREEEKRYPGQLADMATFRRLFKQKLEISMDEATAILEKHQLGKVQALKSLEANFMNAP